MNEFERADPLEKIVLRCLYLMDECPIARLLRLMNSCGMGFMEYWGREYQRDEVVKVLESFKSRGLATTGIGLDFCTRDFINDDEVCYLLTEEGNERASKLELPDISLEILAARQQKEAEHEARKRNPVLERELSDFVLYMLRNTDWMYPDDFIEATNFVYSCWREAGGYTVSQEEMVSIIAALTKDL